MKKVKNALLGVMLSLTMAASGLTGVTAQLTTVYAEENEDAPATIGETSTCGVVAKGISKEGYKASYFTDSSRSTPMSLDEIKAADPGKGVYVWWTLIGTGEDEEGIDEEEPEATEAEPYETTEEVPGETYEEYDDPQDPAEEVPAVEEPEEDPAEEVPAVEEPEEYPAEEAPAVEEPEEPETEEAAPAEEAEEPEAEDTEEAAPAEEAEEAETEETEEAAPAEEADEAKADDDLNKAGEKYTVTFDVQGHGKAPKAQEVETGNKATKPADPSAEGYAFEGWFTDKECTKAYNFDETVTADVTLYAKWTPEKFTVEFKTDRGTPPAAQTVTYPGTATEPSVPFEGYTIESWMNGDVPYDFSKSVIEDLTLVAKWRPNRYTIHFDPNNSAYASATGATGDVAAVYDEVFTLTKNGFVRNADWQFLGWSTASGTAPVAFQDQAKDKNLTGTDGATVTLYAQWKFIYKMVAGAGAAVSKLDTRGLTFQTNGFVDLFTGITVDGVAVPAANYTVSAANYGTYVTLKQSYINTLSLGQHTITFLYKDGSVATTFTVNNSTVLNPVQTGDNNHMALWLSLIAAAAVVAVGLVLIRKKYRN